MTAKPRFVILGAGPAGLGAALWLARRGFDPVVVESGGAVGGNAGSFRLQGLSVDYGSHRLHPSTDPEILAELQELLGTDLLERPRHGRILLDGRWIHFPLRPLDMALRAPPSFLLRAARDLTGKLLWKGLPFGTAVPGPASQGPDTFASVLERGLGATISHEFYFPYAKKIWGLEPAEISPIQAAKRVGAGSAGRLMSRLLPWRAGPGKGRGFGSFFYPRKGFGQISDKLWEASVSAGARVDLNTKAQEVEIRRGGGTVYVEGPEGTERLTWDHLWSTVPVVSLVKMMTPRPPTEVLHAADSLEQRAMLLVYLVVGVDQFTEFDAHYFPSPEIPFTRLSEPKNYSASEQPLGRTVLCAEIPCSKEDLIWTIPKVDLGDLVKKGLARAGLTLRGPVLEVEVRRLPSAYPLYREGFEKHLEVVEQWLERLPGVLAFGRQGLFAHDNTHHALFTARAAVHCVGSDGRFDAEEWASYRRMFENHIVED